MKIRIKVSESTLAAVSTITPVYMDNNS